MLGRLFCAAFAASTFLCAEAAIAADPPMPQGGGAVLQWTPEQQAWGYRNFEKVGQAKVIARGKHVHPLPVAAHQIDPVFTAGGKTYDTASYMAAFRASGILVLKDGKIVLERYGLGRGPHDRWTSFSVAKSVTSTLIGASSVRQLEDNVKALDRLDFSAAELEQIETILKSK